ncbi:type VI secretion system tube protein Hcp [Roseobacter sp.]|uniref:Hcp family type VI secretion system effector n=1 Tax=Roseobacter sp. TaxID=1907202 RepID=UPI003299A8DE
MAFDSFLYFPKNPTIKGETLDEEMAKQGAFQITQFGFGATNSSVIDSQSGGGGVGKTDFEDFTCDKLTDSASAGLYRACATGTHIEEAIMECRRQGSGTKSGQRSFFLVRFKTVIVKGVTWAGSGDELTESLVFSYGAKQIEYRRQGKDGTMIKPSGGQGEAEWSKVLNQEKYEVQR